MDALLNHRGHNQEEETCEQTAYDDEGTQDAKDAILHATAVLEELDHWEQNVGDKPRQEEGREHTTQSVEQHDDAYGDDDPNQATHKHIKVNLLTNHVCNLFCFLLQR